MYGFEATQAIRAIARLGIADRIRQGPVRAEALARDLGVDARLLFRLMRYAAALGVLTQDRTDRFGLSRLGKYLRSDIPGSIYPLALLCGEEYYRAAGALLDCVRTGKPAFQIAHRAPFFAYLGRHPATSRTFNASMLVRVLDYAKLAARFDFGAFPVVVDVGGGRGGLIAAVLRRHPSVHGVLFDQAHVLPEARRYLDGAGVLDRCRTVGGSAFASIPAGADAYIESVFLHDLDDRRAATVLRNIRNAIPEDGTLLLVEHVVPPGGRPSLAKSMDIRMMEIGGLERTETEWRVLLVKCRFQLRRTLDVGIAPKLLVARPI